MHGDSPQRPRIPEVHRDLFRSVEHDESQDPKFYDRMWDRISSNNPKLAEWIVARAHVISNGDASLKSRFLNFGLKIYSMLDRQMQAEELEEAFVRAIGDEPEEESGYLELLQVTQSIADVNLPENTPPVEPPEAA